PCRRLDPRLPVAGQTEGNRAVADGELAGDRLTIRRQHAAKALVVTRREIHGAAVDHDPGERQTLDGLGGTAERALEVAASVPGEVDLDAHFVAGHLDGADPVAREIGGDLRARRRADRNEHRRDEQRDESTVHDDLLLKPCQKSRRAMAAAAPYNIAVDAAALASSPAHGSSPERKKASALITR